MPPDNRDSYWNNAAIAKIQYQHNMGSNAYFRIYGYSFYSDWLQASPLSYGTPFFGFGALSYDYELESHTRGLSLSFADQIELAASLHVRRELHDRNDEPLQQHEVQQRPGHQRDQPHQR